MHLQLLLRYLLPQKLQRTLISANYLDGFKHLCHTDGFKHLCLTGAGNAVRGKRPLVHGLETRQRCDGFCNSATLHAAQLAKALLHPGELLNRLQQQLRLLHKALLESGSDVIQSLFEFKKRN